LGSIILPAPIVAQICGYFWTIFVLSDFNEKVMEMAETVDNKGGETKLKVEGMPEDTESSQQYTVGSLSYVPETT
jgi:hypothetical protein